MPSGVDLFSMVRHIPGPRTVPAAGSPPKLIEEFVGRLASGTDALSIARMRSPPGWSEPPQRAAFDEYTLVLAGALVVGAADGPIVVGEGEAVHVRAGERVEYSTPEGAEYIAVCLPAFDPGLAGREGAGSAGATPRGLPEEIVFEVHGPDGLGRIEPLWEGLAAHHVAQARAVAPAFLDEMGGKTFAARRAELLEKNRDRALRVELAVDGATGVPVGYCVSSAAPNSAGEVESVYVDEAYRGRGIGSALLEHASTWMDGVGVTEQAVLVFAGNDGTLPFYARHGFLPRFCVLIRRA